MIPPPKAPVKFVELSPTSDSVFASWEGSSENVKSYVVLYQQVGQPWHPKVKLFYSTIELKLKSNLKMLSFNILYVSSC